MQSNNHFISMALVLAFACLCMIAADETACSSALSADPDTYLCPDRGFTLMLPRTVAPKAVQFLVEHRGHSPAFTNPLRDGLGFDNGALKIGLGLRYAPLDRMDAGVRRVNNGLDRFDTYEFDARYRFLDESSHIIDAAVDAGITLFTQDTYGIASGFIASAVSGKSITDRLYCATGLLYHSNSTYTTKTTADPDWSLAIPLLFSFRAVAGLSLLTEWYFPTAGYSAGNPGYACGFKYATWRHSFSLLLTNTQYTTMDGVVCGSGRLNNPVLGFMIVRKFGGE
jgi:hypothetical protein